MNLPNKICMARILMCPVFFYLFISGNYLASAILYLIAASTDWLDGYIARKYNLVTDLGKFLDPIADKILVLSGMLIAISLSTTSLPSAEPGGMHTTAPTERQEAIRCSQSTAVVSAGITSL